MKKLFGTLILSLIALMVIRKDKGWKTLVRTIKYLGKNLLLILSFITVNLGMLFLLSVSGLIPFCNYCLILSSHLPEARSKEIITS